MKATIWHNPACGTSRKTLAILEETPGVDLTVIPYLTSPPSAAMNAPPHSPARQNARTLSGGQQQRLAFARAWALRPDVLLLDEPTASLDPHAKREVEALMADFAASHGSAGPGQPMTMLFSSHNLGQVKRLASRVIYLEHGQLVADLPVHDFFNGPLPEAARLFVKGELV